MKKPQKPCIKSFHTQRQKAKKQTKITLKEIKLVLEKSAQEASGWLEWSSVY